MGALGLPADVAWRKIRGADTLLPAVMAAVGTVELVAGQYTPAWAALASYWLACATLCLRRAVPLLVPPGAAGWYAAGAFAGVDVGEPASWILPLVFSCFAAGRWAPWPARLLGHWPGLVSVLTALAVSFAALGALTEFDPDVLFGLIATVVPWLLGRGFRRELERSAAAAARAERLLVEREHAVREAASAERERIARELHDVLAHSLSVMVVQSSLAEDLVTRDGERATQAMRAVQQCGRDALAETGRLVRLIRDDRDELGTQTGHDLSELQTLVEGYRQAGLSASLDVDAAVVEAPVGLQLSIYRIVQESLTNALKHAPGSSVRVRLSREDGELRVEVSNGPPSSGRGVGSGGGHGLVGLRERVALFGGSLRYGATGDGGYRLSASLPLDPAP